MLIIKTACITLLLFQDTPTPSPAPVYSRDLNMVFEKDESSSTKKGTQNKTKSSKVEAREKPKLDKPAAGLVTNSFYFILLKKSPFCLEGKSMTPLLGKYVFLTANPSSRTLEGLF